MSKDMFDAFWEQNKRSVGGFSSLNQKDEECLKKAMRSLVIQTVQSEPSATNASVELDYDRLYSVIYGAVKAAMTETMPGKLQTYAVPEALREHRAAVEVDSESLPDAFFQSKDKDNLSSAKAETVESNGVTSSIQALKRLKGDS